MKTHFPVRLRLSWTSLGTSAQLAIFVTASVAAISGCATSSSTSKKPAPVEAKETAPAKDAEPGKVSSVAAPTTAGAAVETKNDIQLSLTSSALVGNWTGEDARSIVGTLRLCDGGRALIVVNGEALGAELGPNVTWSVMPVRTGVAQLRFHINGSAGEKDVDFLVRRPGERRIDLAMVTKKTADPKFSDANPKDIVPLQREANAPDCDAL